MLKQSTNGWKKKTYYKLRLCNEITALLLGSTNECNLYCLHREKWEDGELQLHREEALQLDLGEAQTIFKTVFECLEKNKIEIAHIRFAGKQNLPEAIPYLQYIHCRNHRLALCFVHLIPQFPNFENFDSLLLNLHLLQNSSVKQFIFEEVQTGYDLPTLKFD